MNNADRNATHTMTRLNMKVAPAVMYEWQGTVSRRAHDGMSLRLGRVAPMTTTTYAADRTALLIVDPYNDF
jgi:hypothetical protein